MSATIYWRPISKNDKHLSVGAPYAFQEKMREAGLTLPCTIDDSHKILLTGMAVGFGREKERPNPFDEILSLLDKHDSVELWAIY